MNDLPRSYETGILHDPLESLAVVDENDRIVGEALRKDVHAPNKGLLHREVSVYIVDAMSRILLQNKKDYGLNLILLQSRAENHNWDATAGHVRYDSQEYLETAVRECREELGLEIAPECFEPVAKLRFNTITDDRHNNRFLQIYVVEKHPLEKITINVTEVAEVKLFSSAELADLASNPNAQMRATTKQVILEHILPRYS